MNKNKIIYWIATVFMCGVFAFSASMYFARTEMVKMIFVDYGFPSWIVIPLAIIKILGIIPVISKLSKVLMEWAYAGFFFDAALVLCTHYVAGDGGYLFSAIAIVSIIVSRVMLPKAFPKFAG